MLYHLTTRPAWVAAQQNGEYRALSLIEEGFIHCSTKEQLVSVANAFYRDVETPVVLWIDPEKLLAPVRWEAPDPDDPFAENRFPHVYGPINLEAVTRVTELLRAPDGFFTRF